MPLMRVVLRLGRNPDAGFPEGDDAMGYVVVAPLDAGGALDVKQWEAAKERCKVVRFTPDHEDDADGMLLHRGARWFFHYDDDAEGPDEPVYRLGDHTLRVGDYVTIHEADGEDLTFKVTESRPV